MTEIPLNQIVRLTAWNVSQSGAAGQSHGTCLTAMDQGTNVKLMRAADRDYLLTTPPPIRYFMPVDQLFTLAPAANGGFRIVKYGSEKCLDAGDWFFNPDGSRTNVRHLLLNKVDAGAASQIFFAEKGEGYAGVDAWKLLSTLGDGNRYELTPNDYPSKDFVLVTLGRGGTPSSDLFAVQPYDFSWLQEQPWQATAPAPPSPAPRDEAPVSPDRPRQPDQAPAMPGRRDEIPVMESGNPKRPRRRLFE
jgi:hypothetical protein